METYFKIIFAGLVLAIIGGLVALFGGAEGDYLISAIVLISVGGVMSIVVGPYLGYRKDMENKSEFEFSSDKDTNKSR